MAAKGIRFPRRWYGGMISANLEVIWAMSVKTVQETIETLFSEAQMHLRRAISFKSKDPTPSR